MDEKNHCRGDIIDIFFQFSFLESITDRHHSWIADH